MNEESGMLRVFLEPGDDPNQHQFIASNVRGSIVGGDC